VRAVALVALVMLGYVPRSYAADDAPLVAEDPKCFDAQQRANIAAVITGKDARIASLEKDAGKVPPVPLIVTALIALGAGFAAGFGARTATAPKP